MNLKVIEFCAREVAYQKRGPEQVWWMLEAWSHAQGDDWTPSEAAIQRLGWLVERNKNLLHSWRRVNVRVGPSIKAPFEKVPELMNCWLSDHRFLAPEAAYVEFEEIHPFGDGNGRVGKIIFNWLSKSMDNPAFPKSYGENTWHWEMDYQPD